MANLKTTVSRCLIAGTFAVSVLGLLAVSNTSSRAHGSKESSPKDNHGSKYAFGSPDKPANATRTIEIIMKDHLFEPNAITVKPGETVRFMVHNRGESVHEFNIGMPNMHMAHRKEMMMMMDKGILESDRINHNMMNMKGGMTHNDPNSVLLEPGKSAEIVWKFRKTNKLEIACNVPGHYESGMHGPVNFGG